VSTRDSCVLKTGLFTGCKVYFTNTTQGIRPVPDVPIVQNVPAVQSASRQFDLFNRISRFNP
jgi:hypothetical protein